MLRYLQSAVTCVGVAKDVKKYQHIHFCRRRAVSYVYVVVQGFRSFQLATHNFFLFQGWVPVLPLILRCLPFTLFFYSIQFHRVACLFFVVHSYIRKSSRLNVVYILLMFLCVSVTNTNKLTRWVSERNERQKSLLTERKVQFTLILISF